MFLPTLLQGKIPIQHFIVFFSATQTISQLSGTQVSSHKLSKVQPALFDIVFPNTLGTFAPEEELWMCYNSKSYKNTSEMALQFQLIDVWQALVPLLKKKMNRYHHVPSYSLQQGRTELFICLQCLYNHWIQDWLEKDRKPNKNRSTSWFSTFYANSNSVFSKVKIFLSLGRKKQLFQSWYSLVENIIDKTFK